MNQGTWQTSAMDQQEMAYTSQDQYVGEQDMQMQDVGDDCATQAEKKRLWERLGQMRAGTKRKPNPAKKNNLLRKALVPKNSVMCLNELVPGLKYTAERVATVGNFSVTVEVNGQSYVGYGSSKDQAKQAAAEAALMSFVKPPPPKGIPNKPEDDPTPWKTLGSFAMYKLFTDWRDNKVGTCQNFPQNAAMTMPQQMGFQAMLQQIAPPATAAANNSNNGSTTGVDCFSNISLHLNRNVTALGPDGEPQQAAPQMMGAAVKAETRTHELKPIKESKIDPAVSATRHPVMVLHQLCPQIQYTSVEKLDDAGKKAYHVSAVINGVSFTGEATAVKKAKLMLAKEALKEAYGIDSVYAQA